MSAIGAAGAALLGGTLRRAGRLPGGDLSEVVHIVLEGGREAVVKGGPAPPVEAAMLRAIAAAGVPAPAVLALDDRLLVLEYLPSDGDPGAASRSLGEALARLHDVTGPRFGWDTNYAFGAVAIENGWLDDWAEFWGERRLIPFLPHVPADLGRRVEVLARDLPDRLPARPRPSLLHGDLWQGNVLAAGGRVTGLIDPACYHGHGEVDLAMLDLFGHPGPAFRDGYGPSGPGAAERRPIYQLWPALVHLRLFGAGYRGLVERKLAEAGA